jgi:hypothetical protein
VPLINHLTACDRWEGGQREWLQPSDEVSAGGANGWVWLDASGGAQREKGSLTRIGKEYFVQLLC